MKRIALLLLRVLFGLSNAAAAGYFLHLEAHKPEVMSARFFACLAWLAFGLATAAPVWVFGTLGKMLALAKPYLPRVTIGKPPEAP